LASLEGDSHRQRVKKMETEGAFGQVKRGTASFCFYRIVNGIKKIFSFCKELYRFRENKKRKHPHFFTLEDYLNKYEDKFPLC
jgi:hypothetical protein